MIAFTAQLMLSQKDLRAEHTSDHVFTDFYDTYRVKGKFPNTIYTVFLAYRVATGKRKGHRNA